MAHMTTEQRKARFANLSSERMKNPKAFEKARRSGFNAVNFVNKEFGADITPAEKLKRSVEVRKSTIDSAHISSQEKNLKNKILRLGKKRVDTMIHGGEETPREIWQKEKKAVIELAKLQNVKLREGFAES